MNIMHKEVLPVWEKGCHKGKVNWKESIGYFVPFEYNGLKGEVEIMDVEKRRILLKYNNIKKWIKEASFNSCSIGNLIYNTMRGFKYSTGEIKTAKNKNKVKIIKSFYKERQSKERLKKDKYVEYECLTCGNIDEIPENLIEKSINICNVCCNPSKKTLKGYNDIATTHPHLIKYFKNINDAYTNTYNSERPVVFKCPKCGNEQNVMLSNITGRLRKGYECKQCGSTTSYPERFAISLFNFKNIKYITQTSKTTLPWCNKYRYDFYIPSLNMIIETHGEQHGKFITSGELTLVKRTKGFCMSNRDDIKIDADKCWLAYKNGIREYIPINCFYSNGNFILDNMKNSNLSNYIDLNLTNEEFNIIKENI